MFKILGFGIVALFFLKNCQPGELPEVYAPERTHLFRGLSFVAPPNPFNDNPMTAVKTVNADCIAVIPYAYTRVGEPKVYFNTNRQWWGERLEGVEETIRLAKASGLKIMLKPQVYVPRSWTGDLDFEEEEWPLWEADYTEYILTFARVAAEMDVKAFCVGTEFKIAVKKREDYWRGLIKKVKEVYQGDLVYAANWDEYPDVPFWEELDYAGINAYFPLIDEATPTVEQLKKAWIPYQTDIRNFYRKHKVPVVFTEYGYLSVDRTAFNTWELEGKVKSLPINESAQANAIQALLETFWQEPYWYGGFIWKWFPEMQGGEGYNSRDYTPQRKKAEEVLKDCYAKPIPTQ